MINFVSNSNKLALEISLFHLKQACLFIFAKKDQLKLINKVQPRFLS